MTVTCVPSLQYPRPNGPFCHWLLTKTAPSQEPSRQAPTPDELYTSLSVTAPRNKGSQQLPHPAGLTSPPWALRAGRIPTRVPACSMQREWALPLAAQLLQDNQCSSCWRPAAQAHTFQSPPSRWRTAALGGHRWDCSLHAASQGSSLGIWSQDSEEHDLQLRKGWKINSYSCIISFYSHRLGSAAHLGSTNHWT